MSLSETFIWLFLHVITSMSLEIKIRYELSESKTEQGNYIQTQLLIVQQPSVYLGREYAFTIYENQKKVMVINFSRSLDFESVDGNDNKFVKYHVYAWNMSIEKPDKQVGLSLIFKDYSMAGMSWFDTPVEKIVDLVKVKGLEWLLHELFEAFKSLLFSWAFSEIV